MRNKTRKTKSTQHKTTQDNTIYRHDNVVLYKTRQGEATFGKIREATTISENIEYYKTRQDKTIHYKTIQDNTRQYKTREDKVRQCMVRQYKPKQGKARLYNKRWNHMKQSETK